MQKKVLWSSLVVLCLVIIALAFVFWPRNIENVNNPSNQACNPYLDISTIVKTGDLKSCDCLTDVAQKSLCQNNISNATSYTSAIEQADLSQCNKIGDPGMKAACINITQGRIDFTNKNLNASSTNK
jgi:hypothetical protein